MIVFILIPQLNVKKQRIRFTIDDFVTQNIDFILLCGTYNKIIMNIF